MLKKISLFAFALLIIFQTQNIFGQASNLLSTSAKAEFGKENFEPCIAEMSKLIKLKPKNDAALVERARCLFLSADDTNDFKKFLAEKSKTISDAEKAEAAANEEMFSRKAKAIADATKAISLNPKNAEAYNIRGLVKSTRTTQERNESLADFDKAIALDPKFIKPYFNRAMWKLMAKDDEGAIADFDKVIELDPKNAKAIELRSTLLNEQENKNQAREKCLKSAYPYNCVPTLKEYADKHPTSAKAFLDLARANNSVEVYYSIENREVYWKNAEAAYLKAIQLDANNFAAYSELVELYLKKLGEPNKALAIANNAVKALPNNADAFVLRGQTLLIPFDAKNALNDFNKAIELNPKSYSAYIGRGDVYVFQKEPAKALVEYNKSIEINGINGQVYLKRGVLYATQKNFKESLNDFTTAYIAKEPCARSYRGNTYTLMALNNGESRDTGNFLKAKKDFLEDDSQKCYLTHYLYGQTLYAQRFNKEALEQFEFALFRFKQGSEPTVQEVLTARKAIEELKSEIARTNPTNSTNSTNSSGNSGKTITQILEEYKRDLPSEGLTLVASGVYNYSVISDPKLRFTVERVGFGRRETYVFIGIKEDGAEFGFDVIYDDRFIAKPTGTTLPEKAEYGFNSKIEKDGKFSINETNFYLPNTTTIRSFQISPRGGGTSNVYWLVFKK